MEQEHGRQRILLLGGTGFLGRAICGAALRRGHEITCLARGSGRTAPGAEFIRADRDEDQALHPVRNQSWDAVIDLTSQPVHARRAVRELRSRHWVLISSTSAYAHHDVPQRNEQAETVPALDQDRMSDPAQYPAAKRACEKAYQQAHGRLMVIRPGLIGGQEDPTGRSGYYPWRFSHPTGQDALVPDLTMPTALIDVEDLAQWIIRSTEHQTAGVFNATGEPTELREIIRLSAQLAQERTGFAPEAREVPEQQLLDLGVTPWMGPRSLPLWIPLPQMRYAAWADRSSAVLAGLRTRPLRETLQAALVGEEQRGGPGGGSEGAGLTDEEERQLRRELAGS